MKEQTTNPFEELIQNLISEIKEDVQKRGNFSIATCDTNSYGWSKQKHLAMQTIQRRGIPEMYISCSIKWGVTDWIVTIN